VLGLRPAPEFAAWLEAMGVMHGERLLPIGERHRLLEGLLPEGSR
jgi:ethanolamine ammonia-lyase large subunit